ncbi:protein of unknown function [Methylocaldum szegediense]|uniref:Peptidase S24/S26A/S26B/S26C domain-containing protein n=1 Tax=Methylocaldum szegediense TaxID=73780 RepID=A0ABN8X836_9GAMM|nr:protein of unknown function [Methylocaldum szegediense]
MSIDGPVLLQEGEAVMIKRLAGGDAGWVCPSNPRTICHRDGLGELSERHVDAPLRRSQSSRNP